MSTNKETKYPVKALTKAPEFKVQFVVSVRRSQIKTLWASVTEYNRTVDLRSRILLRSAPWYTKIEFPNMIIGGAWPLLQFAYPSVQGANFGA